jgi:hypothetical protein
MSPVVSVFLILAALLGMMVMLMLPGHRIGKRRLRGETDQERAAC